MATYQNFGLAGAPTSAWLSIEPDAHTFASTSVILLPNLDAEGTYTRITGSFVLDANGDPVSGTISTIERVSGDETKVYERITGVSAAIEDFLTNPTLRFFDVVLGSNDLVQGGEGADEIPGYAGNDTLLGSSSSDTLDGGEGDDWVEGGSEGDRLLGGAGNDRLIGDQGFLQSAIGDGADTLLGGAGNDTLLGRGGDDELIGGDGDDSLDGGGGIDTAVFAGTLFDGNGYSLRINSDGSVTVDADGTTHPGEGITTLYDIERIDFGGTIYALVVGNGDPNLLAGTSGNEIILGGDGDDIISASAGNDAMGGGNGFDTLLFSSFVNGVTVDMAAATAFGSATGSDVFGEFETIVGSQGIDNLMGDSGANQLDGFSGHDRLEGRGGNDTLLGGDGHDRAVYSGNFADYTIDASTPLITITDNRDGSPDGTDTLIGIETLRFADDVVALGETTFSSNYTNLGVAGAPTIPWFAVEMGGEDGPVSFSPTLIELPNSDGSLTRIIGSGFALDETEGLPIAGTVTRIERTDAANTVVYEVVTHLTFPFANFASEDDFFRTVFAGTDLLVGSTGNDTLIGGAGGDTFVGNSGLNFVSYADAPAPASGTGGVFADLGNASNNTTGNPASSPQDAIGDTYFGITGLMGTTYDDTLRGGDSTNDTLLGGDGNDVLRGRGGSDVLSGGNGFDFADYAEQTTSITIDLGNPANNVGAPALDTLISIEGLIGGSAADTLRGDGNSNFLRGGLGGDVLDGAGGTDYADYRNAGPGLVVDLENPANNTVGSEARGDTYISIEGIRGSGNADVLRGNAGDNFLRGGPGGDTLDGGAGGSDTAEYNNATSGVTADLGDAMLNAGEAAGDQYVSIENLRGSAFADTLRGDAGSNRLRGDGANDTLVGGADNDVAQYAGAQASYSLSFNPDGSVTVTDLRPGSPDGTDTLTGIEFIQYLGGGGTVALSGAPNQPPNSLLLSGTHVAENSVAGTLIGLLTATDPNPGDTLTYTITNPAAVPFEIVNGNQLVVKSGATIDFETSTNYWVNVEVSDGHGGIFPQTFTVLVDNVVELPTGVALAGGALLAENSPAGAIVGFIEPLGGEAFGAYAYEIVADPSGLFQINGSNQLALRPLSGLIDFEQVSSYQITLVAHEAGVMGGPVSMPLLLTIGVADQATELADGTSGADSILGGSGNDTLNGNGGADTLVGGGGDDMLTLFDALGYLGTASISGGAGNDTLNDQAMASPWVADLGSGDDTVYVGPQGNKSLTLGAGHDTVVLQAPLPFPVGDASVLTIADFEIGAGGDVLDLTAYLGAPGAPGGLIEQIRLVQDGTDTVLRWVPPPVAPGSPPGPTAVDYVRFQGADATAFTSDNFIGGLPPIYTGGGTNMPPMVTMSAPTVSIPENTPVDPINGLKVADIFLMDPDGGPVTLGLDGADAALFSIRSVGGTHELMYRGPALDFEAPIHTFNVIVTADDSTIGPPAMVESSAMFTLEVTNVPDDVIDLTPRPFMPESQVNTTADGAQHNPAVAALADGGFVVTWTSVGQDGSGDGIYAQRYTAMPSGGPGMTPGPIMAVGGEFLVNTSSADNQSFSSVAGLEDGGFVVTWQSNGQDGSSGGIYAQRFDATGMAAGGEQLINTTTSNHQAYPAISALVGGGYVVMWDSIGQDGAGQSIHGQRFAADGTPVGGEFRANSETSDDQKFAFVTPFPDGGFLAVWESTSQDGSGAGVYAQRYAADGSAVGAEFHVNTTTSDAQQDASATAFDDGSFVVTWQSFDQDGSSYGVYGQRFAADATPVGAEFQVNTFTSGQQSYAWVSPLADGGFLVSWSSDGQDGSGHGVYGQRFAADGTRAGNEFRVNEWTAGEQVAVTGTGAQTAATLLDGRVVQVWAGFGAEEISYRLIDIPAPNRAPTSVTLEGPVMVMENSMPGMPLVGLRAIDPDIMDTTFTFQLLDDAGGRIQIIEGHRLATGPVNIDYEALTDGKLHVIVTATDSHGATSAPMALTIDVMDQPIESFMGTPGDDTFVGSSGMDMLRGAEGDDSLVGMGGDDRFEGGQGADTLDGGDGYDTAWYGDSSDPMTIHLDGTPGTGGTAEGDVLSGIEEVQGGGGADLIVGDGFANRILGNGGSDTLLGNGGNDTISGIYGDIEIDGGAGVDTVEAWMESTFPLSIASNGAGGWTITVPNHVDGDPPSVRTQTLSNVEVVTLQGASKLLVGNGGFATAAEAHAWADANGVSGYELLSSVPTNNAPTGVVLAPAGVDENASVGTYVGTLATTDPDAGDTFTYTLIDDAGGRFVLDGDIVRVADGAGIDFEAPPPFFGLTVRTTDAGGLSVESTVFVAVENVDEAPTGITLDAISVSEKAVAGTYVGLIMGYDPDLGDTLTFSLENDADGRFVIDGNILRLSGFPNLDYEADPIHQVVITVSDASGLERSDTFIVNVDDEPEGPPTDIIVDGGAVLENSVAGTVVATLSASDPDVGETHSFAIVDDPSGFFEIVGNQIVVKDGATIDFEAAESHTVRISAVDQLGQSYEEDVFISVGDVSPVIGGSSGADLRVGTSEDDTFDLLAGNDTAIGGGGADTLLGGLGNDSLAGGEGIDSLVGGSGNDIYVLAAGDSEDAIVEVFGEGTDTVQLAADFDSGSFVLGDNIEGVVVQGSTGLDVRGNALSNSIRGGAGADTLDGGGAGADTLTGGSGEDVYIVHGVGERVVEVAGGGIDEVRTALDTFSLAGIANVEDLTYTGAANFTGTGNTLANVITGGDGDDLIDGKSGADLMIGGEGDDTYVVDNALDAIIESGSGWDLVRSSVSYTLGGDIESLELTGTANLTATGNAGANHITGNTGANLIDGLAGADTMLGGAGNDSYVVDDSSDVVVEEADQGTDTVKLAATFADTNYTLGENVENAIVLGAGGVALTGNAGANRLTGGDGGDSLDGGDGTDTLAGGLGNDTYVLGAGDMVSEVASGGVADEIVTTMTEVSLAGYANVENLTYTGTGGFIGTGSAAANVIVSGAGADLLSGGAGADTLRGGAGGDTYIVDNVADVVDELGMDGAVDLVRSSVSYTLGAGVEQLELQGVSSNISGTGNELDNVITGNAGSNRLDGAGGADTMVGGSGADTYVVDHALDVVTELASGGMDLVQTTLSSFDLGSVSEVENLLFTGSGGFSGAGNTLANSITGGDADDTLTGGDGNDVLNGGAGNDSMSGDAGADVMRGGSGNDTYVLDVSTDRAIESIGEGVDTVVASFNYTLGANLENLVLTGSAVNGLGNGLDNLILGTSTANSMTGSTGHDTLVGGGGADTLLGGAGFDRIVVADLAFAKVDGGTDQDVLAFGFAGTIDLTSIANNRILGTEGIDLGKGDDARALVLRIDDVRDMSSAANSALVDAAAVAGIALARPTDTVVIYGDGGDSVALAPGIGTFATGSWLYAGDASIGADVFKVYNFTVGSTVHGTLALDSDIQII
jgi:serralysin